MGISVIQTDSSSTCTKLDTWTMSCSIWTSVMYMESELTGIVLEHQGCHRLSALHRQPLDASTQTLNGSPKTPRAFRTIKLPDCPKNVRSRSVSMMDQPLLRPIWYRIQYFNPIFQRNNESSGNVAIFALFPMDFEFGGSNRSTSILESNIIKAMR